MKNLIENQIRIWIFSDSDMDSDFRIWIHVYPYPKYTFHSPGAGYVYRLSMQTKISET